MKEKTSVSELKSHLGYHLRVVSNAVSQAFAKSLADSDVTVAEWVILREMYSLNLSTSPSVIAEMTGLTRGAISKLIDRLIHKDLVTRDEVSEDRRYQEIKLTPKAIKLVPKLAQIADLNDETFFGVLTQSEKKTMVNLLIKLAKHHDLNTNPIE